MFPATITFSLEFCLKLNHIFSLESFCRENVFISFACRETFLKYRVGLTLKGTSASTQSMATCKSMLALI